MRQLRLSSGSGDNHMDPHYDGDGRRRLMKDDDVRIYPITWFLLGVISATFTIFIWWAW